jgi:LacI family sucrose operon transcriptional repressor
VNEVDEMVTINDIADLAGVSRTTVSRVLNSSGYVSEKARNKVLKVIEQTGYVPSEHAKSLRTKKTKVIGVLLPKVSTETVSRIVEGIEYVLSENGYHILLASANLVASKELEHLQLLQSRRVEGIILVATNTNDELVQTIQSLTIPVTALGQNLPGISCVLYKDYQAAYDVVSLLIKKGHTRIGFIGVDEADPAVGIERKKAYYDCMKQAGLNVKEGWVQKGVFNIDSGAAAMERMLKNSAVQPTAIFAVTDRLAVGAMQTLKQEGISVPEEMAVMSIGASDLSEYVTPPLATVNYFHEKAGRETAKLMLNQIHTKDTAIKKISMDYRLIERDSLL